MRVGCWEPGKRSAVSSMVSPEWIDEHILGDSRQPGGKQKYNNRLQSKWRQQEAFWLSLHAKVPLQHQFARCNTCLLAFSWLPVFQPVALSPPLPGSVEGGEVLSFFLGTSSTILALAAHDSPRRRLRTVLTEMECGEKSFTKSYNKLCYKSL